MRSIISLGVCVKRHSGFTVLIDGRVFMFEQPSLTIEGIKKSVDFIRSEIPSFNCAGSAIYACIDGDEALERQIGIWQGALADLTDYVIPVDFRSWYCAVVHPYTKREQALDLKNTITNVAKFLAPGYRNELSYQGFAESFHLARYARMVGGDIENNLLLMHRDHTQTKGH